MTQKGHSTLTGQVSRFACWAIQTKHCPFPINRLQCGTGVQISDQTVRNRLHSSGLRSRCPLVGLIFTPHHHAAWRTIAGEHQNWHPVLFTDESRLSLGGSDRRVRLWKSTGERMQHCPARQVRWWVSNGLEKHIPSRTYETDLHVLNRGNLTDARYRDEINRAIVKIYTDAVGPVFLLIHDNALLHVARVCRWF